MEPAYIGRYEIHALLGQGGMGTVYRARDPMMDRWVAIKALTVQDSHQQARFRQEVRAAGSLNHPHITTTYDVGAEGDLAYIVMELVEGSTLADRLSTPTPWPETLKLLLPVCQALAYAHQRGVIHRDVKPANILLSNDGRVKLTDFGLARLEAALRRITESGSTVGTPLYTAPEQIRDETVDGRADLFSLGIVLFELISGQHPFTSSTMAQAVYRITHSEPADLTPLRASVPPTVLSLVEQALQKEPQLRFADAVEMAAAMNACLDEIGAAPEAQPALRPDSASQRPNRPVSSPLPSRQILTYVASDLHLTPDEEQLLQSAFSRHDTVYLEREFRSGYSGARVLLATPVRSGRRLAQLVLKIDAQPAIEHEWRAYREFVSETLPPVTARILEAPQISSDGRLGLLQYSFAGGLGNVPPESLRSYYARHSGEEVATLLEKNVFQAFGDKWWLQRHTHDLILRREYDRLLPVHLLLEHRDFMEATATPHNLVAGQVTALTCRRLESGQMVQVQGFRVEEARAEQGELTLQAASSTGGRSDPIRIRLTGVPIDPAAHQAGQIAPPLTGLVTATRQDQLRRWAETAFPGQDFSQKQLTIGGQSYLNPLYDTESLLDQRISSMRSIIHGDLNLENILVTPSSGLAWLIDFATTRQGHNLFDFMRLETQVITKLLPQTGVSPETVAQMMHALHQPTPAPQQVPPRLRKPFTVLLAVRRMVRKCLYSRDSWDEYYLGLIVTLLGSLKFKEMGADQRQPALAAAATLRTLVTNPALQLTPSETSGARDFTPSPPPSDSGRSRLSLLAAAGAVLLVLAGLGLFIMGVFDDGSEPASTAAGAVADFTPPPTDTPPPTFTPAPSPTITLPAQGEGLVLESLNIHGGPGLDYPPLGTVPLGNMVQITGRSADGQWWQIAYPDGPGGYGWLLAEYIRPETPIAPPAKTPLPPPSPTPTPAPAEAKCLPRTFYRSLSNANPGLGCPTEVWLSDFTFQAFEQGLMLWRKSPTPAQIYVLYENNNWRSLADPQGPPSPACDAAEQNSELGPIRSFGLIWCTEEVDRLGQPLTKEQAAEQVAVERFEGGLAFEVNQTQYLLFDDGDWESLQVEAPATHEPVAAAADTVEDFEGVSGASVREIYDINDAWAVNELVLDVVSLPEADGQALKLDYKIQGGPPDNYAGIERNLPAATNWSAAQALQFWVKNDSVRKELVFQWGESPATGGEVWKHNLVLEPNESRQIDIPLNGASFHWADWSPPGNSQMDLSQVKYYGFFLTTALPSEGTLHLDSMALVTDGTAAAPPTASPTPACKLDPAPDFQSLWAAHADVLGCPVASARTIDFLVEQAFQGGRLFWREDTDEVYLIYDRARDGSQLLAGDWQAPPWKWDGEAGCNLFESPPAGLQTPDRGFGWLWCTHLGGPNGPLGWALDGEEGFDNEGRVQRFEHGLAFKGSRPKSYGLLNNDRFVAYDPAQPAASASSIAPTAEPTAAPSPATSSAESSLFVDMGYDPAELFEPAWRALGADSSPVGYPSGPPIVDRNYAQQYFERGFMFWWDSPQPPQPIWVIFMSGPGANEGDIWRRFDNRWFGGQPEYPPACPEARPPLGPRSGFGVTWCSEAGVKAQLGQPIEGEFGSGGVNPTGTVQYFQGGLMFHNPADQRVWVLVNDNGWYRY